MEKKILEFFEHFPWHVVLCSGPEERISDAVMFVLFRVGFCHEGLLETLVM